MYLYMHVKKIFHKHITRKENPEAKEINLMCIISKRTKAH